MKNLLTTTNLTPEAKLELFRAKVSILYSDNKETEAYDLMKKEEENFKNSAEFKYDYAMLAESRWQRPFRRVGGKMVVST